MKKLAFLLALVVFASIAFGVAYTDVSEGHWAYDSLMKATSAGLLQGFPDGTFKGDETLTRYQFAEAIAKFLDYSDSGDAKLQELVFALTKKVASLSLEISDVKKSVIDIMAEFRSLEGKVAEIDLDNIEQKVWELREDVYGEVTDLEVTTKLLGQSIAKFKDNMVTKQDYETTVAIVNKLTRDVFKLYKSKADAEDLKACNDSIAAFESLLDSNVADLKDSINVVYDQVDANINAIMDIEKSLSDIEGKLGMFAETGDVEALKEKVTNLEVTSKMLSTSVVKLNETVANLSFVTPDQLSEKMGFLYRKLNITESKLSDKLGNLEAVVSSLSDDVEVAFDQIDANIFDIMALESKLADLEKNIEENYVKVDDYNVLVNITNKLSRDVYKLTKAKADVEDIKTLNEEMETLKTETDASIEAVKTDVDARVGKYQKSANLAMILSFVALALGTVALILK